MRTRRAASILKKIRKESDKNRAEVIIGLTDGKFIGGIAEGPYILSGADSLIQIHDGSHLFKEGGDVPCKNIKEIKTATSESLIRLLWVQYEISREAYSAGKKAEAALPFQNKRKY